MKKLNKKGFTLIELLAVIVILALLVAVAIPAVTKYLNTSRKGVFADNAAAAISAVRNETIFEGSIPTGGKVYTLTEVNKFLEKKLNNSPYNKPYDGYVLVTINATTKAFEYSIFLTDGDNCIAKSVTGGGDYLPEGEIEDDVVIISDTTTCQKANFKGAVS